MNTAVSQDAVRSVRSVDGPRLPVLAILGAGVFLFLSVGLFHVWSRVAILEKGYELSAQRSLRQDLMEEQKALVLEIARLRDPARLEKVAAKLGFDRPQPGQIVIMKGTP